MEEAQGSSYMIERHPARNVSDEGAAAGDGEEEAETGVMSFWDPFTLEFHDSHLETWFSRDRLEHWLENDSSVYTSAVIQPALTIIVTWSALSLALRCSLLATCALGVLFSYLSASSAYRSRRVIVISFLRILLAFQSANVALAGLDANVTSGSLIGRLVFWGPLIPLLWSSISMRVPFRQHFFVQLCAALMSSMWVYYTCESAAAHMCSFGSVSSGIDTLMTKIYIPYFHVAAGRISMPCHVVIIFAHFIIGMVIPCLMVYILEVCSRAEFCHKVAGSKYQNRVQTYMWDSLKCAMWMALFFAQLLWVILSFKRDPVA